MMESFVAQVQAFGFNFPPRGWAFCEGQLLPISQNTALFSIIGTMYGGDGRTTMALPNLKGRAIMGPGKGPGLSPRRIAQNVGADTEVLSELKLPNHTHQLEGEGTNVDTPTPTSASLLGKGGSIKMFLLRNTGVANVTMATQSIGQTGNSQRHDIRQGHNIRSPYQVVTFSISLLGIYPSRS
ncbi:MAG: phage tail protein [Flavobacteriales bacterium]|nr:phage tail protein [Flavobacteriales bacterium]